jgi:hypothetical protein
MAEAIQPTPEGGTPRCPCDPSVVAQACGAADDKIYTWPYLTTSSCAPRVDGF